MESTEDKTVITVRFSWLDILKLSTLVYSLNDVVMLIAGWIQLEIIVPVVVLTYASSNMSTLNTWTRVIVSITLDVECIAHHSWLLLAKELKNSVAYIIDLDKYLILDQLLMRCKRKPGSPLWDAWDESIIRLLHWLTWTETGIPQQLLQLQLRKRRWICHHLSIARRSVVCAQYIQHYNLICEYTAQHWAPTSTHID